MPGSGSFRRDGEGECTNADLRALIVAHSTSINEKLDRLTRFIDGESEPERGAKIRLDRLEQDSERRKFWTSTAIVAGVGAIASGIYNFMTRQH